MDRWAATWTDGWALPALLLTSQRCAARGRGIRAGGERRGEEVALGPRPGATRGWEVAAAARGEFLGDFLLVLFFLCGFVCRSGLGELGVGRV